MVHLWLRAESKRNEKRTALTPSNCQKLVQAGFEVTVEKSTQRIFDDADYAKIPSVKMVEEHTWARHREQVPKDAIVIGLKELPENDSSPLEHTHIFFAHCYKQQAGWKEVLGRFVSGKGTLLDLEFLVDERGRRVAAFGYHAGFAGAAIGLEVWAYRVLNGAGAKFESVKPYANEALLIAHVKGQLEAAAKKLGRQPRALVMGALGRCGTGACDMLVKAGLANENIVRWDMAETAKGGPFSEILDADIFVNCIYLSKPIPKFFTLEFIDEQTTKGQQVNLNVVVDVSCDTTNPHNPIPIYSVNTTFDDPLLQVKSKQGKLIDVCSIDHLPTLLPRESSEAFCHDLMPSILELKQAERTRVWKDAEALFKKKVAEMEEA